MGIVSMVNREVSIEFYFFATQLSGFSINTILNS